jgi:hypothetical protein
LAEDLLPNGMSLGQALKDPRFRPRRVNPSRRKS